MVSTDSSAADLGPTAAAAEAKPAVTAPIINISANGTAFAQQVHPSATSTPALISFMKSLSCLCCPKDTLHRLHHTYEHDLIRLGCSTHKEVRPDYAMLRITCSKIATTRIA